MAKANYYAIIPANVRYDADLNANAKLLYGEIVALSDLEGICRETNTYFAELYSTDRRTIGRWISDLEEKGYIQTNTANRNTRIIKLQIGGYDKNVLGGYDKNVLGYDKNAEPIRHIKEREKEKYQKEKNKETPLYNNIYINTNQKKEKEIPFDKSKGKEKDKKVCNVIPPTFEMVAAYCEERNNGIDAQKFIDFYESKGWLVGKSKMKNWQAAVRTWEGRHKGDAKPNVNSGEPKNKPQPRLDPLSGKWETPTWDSEKQEWVYGKDEWQ